jgi:hypothetical protein
MSVFHDPPALLHDVVTLPQGDNRGSVGPVLFPVELLTAFPTFVRHEDQKYLTELSLDWAGELDLNGGNLLTKYQLLIMWEDERWSNI